MTTQYTFPAEFIFSGKMTITAETEKEAIEYFEDQVGLCLGGDIHTTLDDKGVDWDFDPHAEKRVVHKKHFLFSEIEVFAHKHNYEIHNTGTNNTIGEAILVLKHNDYDQVITFILDGATANAYQYKLVYSNDSNMPL